MFNKKPSDDLYIRVLKYCRDNIDTPKQPNSIITFLNETYGYRFVGANNHMQLQQILEFTFGVKNLRNDIPYPMTGEAYFKLLEYEELSLARKNAKEAKVMSIIAIMIAVLVGGLELFINFNN